MQAKVPRVSHCLLFVSLLWPIQAHCSGTGWSIGSFGGRYYDTEPAGILEGNARFAKQSIVALTASKSIWKADSVGLSLEIDGMIGHQWGVATLQEIGLIPVLRWQDFPWEETLKTNFRFAPLGISYTTSISPLELGSTGKGSRTLNLLLIELGFALPQLQSEEIFARLHHRCDIYDLLNKHGANGEDFLVIGLRHYF